MAHPKRFTLIDGGEATCKRVGDHVLLQIEQRVRNGGKNAFKTRVLKFTPKDFAGFREFLERVAPTVACEHEDIDWDRPDVSDEATISQTGTCERCSVSVERTWDPGTTEVLE